MYAVINSGGKQHRVEEGEQLKLEKIEAATGETIEFDEVLMLGSGSDVKIGAPLVEGGKVTAEVVAHGRHEKIRIVKFKRRKHHRKATGHREPAVGPNRGRERYAFRGLSASVTIELSQRLHH